MFKIVFFFSALSIIDFSKPVAITNSDDPKSAEILDYYFNIDPTGQYSYRVVQSDGQEKREELFISGGKVFVVGSFSYIGPDGKQYSVSYSADENGFHTHNVPPAESAYAAPAQLGISSACVGSLLGCGLG